MEDNGRTKVVLCFYQAFKSQNQNREGWGDCSKCAPHPDNARCKGFHKITLRTVIVEVVSERK